MQHKNNNKIKLDYCKEATEAYLTQSWTSEIVIQEPYKWPSLMVFAGEFCIAYFNVN